MASSKVKASCYLSNVTFTCNSSGSYTFSDGDLPPRSTSIPVGCLVKNENNYLNVVDFTINPRYSTAGIFTSVTCANKEVTLFFVNHN